MPKILITGNGFDLNHGLPTAYSDFINILNHIRETEIFDFDNVYSHSCNHQKIKENFKPFTFNQSKIEDIKGLISKNLWFNFFKNELEIETWIDFENKIEYVLEMLFSSAEHIKTKIFSKGSLPIQYTLMYDPDMFNQNIEMIEVLKSFDILKTHQNGYNLQINKDFITSKHSSYTDINFDKISTKLNEELIVFKNIFNLYFEIFVLPLYDNLKANIDKNLFLNISKHYNFNYTPTFEKIYGERKITNFLHGQINSSLNKIVLGISEIPENTYDKRYFFPFTKYYQKLNYDTDYIFLKEYNTKKYDNYYFFFFGHSLDKSDKDYLNEVFDFITELETPLNKIIIIYHESKAKDRLLLNILDIRGKNNIEELMKMKILQFLHIDSQELKDELSRVITFELYHTNL